MCFYGPNDLLCISLFIVVTLNMSERDSWHSIDVLAVQNPLLNSFYEGIFPWGNANYSNYEVFDEYLRKPLPICVRLCKDNGKQQQESAAAMLNLAQALKSQPECIHDEVASSKPSAHKVQWLKSIECSYPDAWQMSLTQRDLRHASIKPFYQPIIDRIDLGLITRQEIVSMLPVIFLNVEPSHEVLDVCAAPGSKTTQILEILNCDTHSMRGGYVVANDANPQRLCVLIHQCCRMVNNAQYLIATRHCAMSFPCKVSFDRILCDVPCTGDGTFRKSPDLWNKWKPSAAFSIHRQQIAILKRSIELLKPNGRLVYSTCSMNPIENEAVLFHCLSKSKHNLRIINVSGYFPAMQHVSGIRQWKVMDDRGNWYSRFTEVPESLRNHLQPSMFPPEVTEESISIENTIRILPHFQNTGGFFIAVIEKGDVEVSSDVLSVEKRPKKDGNKPTFIPLTESNRHIIQAKIGILSDFPFHTLIQRQEEGKRLNVYKISDLAVSLLERCPQINYQHVGMRVFEINHCKNDTVHVLQDAVEMLLPFLPPERIVNMKVCEVNALLNNSLFALDEQSIMSMTCTNVERQRDFFVAVVRMTCGSEYNIGFNWNRFLQRWKTKFSPAYDNFFRKFLEPREEET